MVHLVEFYVPHLQPCGELSTLCRHGLFCGELNHPVEYFHLVETRHLVEYISPRGAQSTLFRQSSPCWTQSPCGVLHLVEPRSTAVLSLHVLHYPYSTFSCTTPSWSTIMSWKFVKFGGNLQVIWTLLLISSHRAPCTTVLGQCPCSPLFDSF